ncbi:MAG TPA: hypothetical protein VHP58_05150 [Alphaproteobacteria bacterium]|nr:hypothetical protein [Alphaproteobacteria bacterium]
MKMFKFILVLLACGALWLVDRFDRKTDLTADGPNAPLPVVGHRMIEPPKPPLSGFTIQTNSAIGSPNNSIVGSGVPYRSSAGY